MIKSRLITTVAVAAVMAAMPLSAGSLPLPLGTTAAQAQSVSISFNLFFEDLEPHGVWVRHARYRYVWCPTVSTRWAPYTRGSWVYLRDRGWYFQSDEPFAWAVYHYGRWLDDERLGWCWVPGSHWAPAWVSWRRGGDYIGWAPLPPEQDGFQISIDVSFGEPERDDWFFVPVRQFPRQNLWTDIIFVEEQPTIYEQTTFIGTVNIENNITINVGPSPEELKAEAGIEVETVNAGVVSDVESLRSAAQATIPAQDLQYVAPDDSEPDEALEEEEAAQVIEEERQAGDERDAEADAEADVEADAEANTDADAAADTEADADAEADVDADAEADADAAADTEADAAADADAETDAAADAAADAATEEGAVEGEVEGEADVDAGAETGDDVVTEDCPVGQELVGGVCKAETADEATGDQVPAQDTTPAADAADEATDAAGQGTDAADQATDAAGQDGTDQAGQAQSDQPADGPAADEGTDAAPAGDEQCPPGLQFINGECLPPQGDAAPAEGEAETAQ